MLAYVHISSNTSLDFDLLSKSVHRYIYPYVTGLEKKTLPLDI